MKKIVFVCLGNICRSPMAEFVMKSLTDQIYVESRATSSWEHGNPIHQKTQEVLRQHGIPYDQKKTSKQITAIDFENFDYIIGMDASNVCDLQKMAKKADRDKIYLFGEKSVPDPWYTGDFNETYDLVLRGCHAWLKRLEERENE